MDHDGFYPTGLSLSRWIPGTASNLRKSPKPTSVTWATPKSSLEERSALPALCPGQQVPTGWGFENGGRDGRSSALRGSGKPAATSKPVMHDGLFLRLLPGLREPQWNLQKAPRFWSMVLGSQLTSGTVSGEQVGCRLLMSHLKSLGFISCCWVLYWEQSSF